MLYISIMEIRDIQAFLALAEELHFGRAAQRLHMTQPPLSLRIRKLEEELGVPLFERTSRSVRLTEAGRVFQAQAPRVLESLDRAAHLARAAAAGQAGRLRVGFVGPALDTGFPQCLKRFAQHYPDVRLELEEAVTEALVRALDEDRLDAALVRLHGHRLEGLDTRLYHTDRYLLAVPADHPLAALQATGLAALHGEPLILYPRAMQPALHDAMLAAFSAAGAVPRIVQEARSKRATLALASAGLGMALVPASARNAPQPGVAWLEVEDPLPAVRIHLAWRPGGSPVLANFLACMDRPGGPGPSGEP